MNKKITIAELIYFIYFGIMFGARAAGLYESLFLYSVSLVLGAAFFMMKVLVTKYSLLEYILMATLLGVSLLVYHNTGEKGMLLYMTMVLGMKGVTLKRIEKWALTVMSVCFTITILLAVTGIKKDIAYPADGRTFFGSVMRRGLGYPIFNTMFTTYIILIVLIMLVVHFDNIKGLIVTSAFLYAFALYFYIYTCSNTGLIVTTVYLALNILFYKINRVNKIAGIFIEMIYPFCMLLSILGPVLITGDAFNKLDQIFHNRFNYSRYYLTTEPITLFGVRFAPAWTENVYIDSSFLYSFLQIGIIPCIILTFMMMKMIHDAVVNNRKKELAVIISFCLLGMSDPFFFNLSYKNLLFLFVADLLFNKWIPYLEKRMPDCFNQKICIIDIGSKELSIRKVPAAYEKSYQVFDRVVNHNGFKHFIVFIVLFLAISLSAYVITDSSVVVGKVDVPDEWEYVRSLLSIGIWISLLIVTFFSNYKKRKRV